MLETILKKTNLRDVFIGITAAFAIICVWRGSWNLLDKFLLPRNFILSQLSSIVLGVSILIIMSRYKS
ncbi:hypothetical protein KAJ38_00620 [Candidatus Pacearchaeota archaeon]|nr:hypothetical protein [Candidatus Pacearchaeota archaeon]